MDKNNVSFFLLAVIVALLMVTVYFTVSAHKKLTDIGERMDSIEGFVYANE